MKVGVLTYHDGINHGGYFQCLYLLNTLKSMGHSVEVIHYKNKEHRINELKAFLIRRNPIKLWSNLSKVIKFGMAVRKLPLSHSRLITTQTELMQVSHRYDVIVVGSDVVWDFEYAFTGNNDAYFGKQLSPRRGLVAYAASCGRTNSHQFPLDLTEGLLKFDSISVRDQNTLKICQNSTGRTDIEVVLDPTLLSDLEESFTETKIGVTSPFILIYAFSLKLGDVEKIKKFAVKHQLITVALGYEQDLFDVSASNVSPLEWNEYIRRASYVVTGTFHGSIFAIKHRKQFVTLGNDGIRHKAGSLLKELGISARYVENNLDMEILTDEINYDLIERRLFNLRHNSIKYLSEALDAFSSDPDKDS